RSAAHPAAARRPSPPSLRAAADGDAGEAPPAPTRPCRRRAAVWLRGPTGAGPGRAHRGRYQAGGRSERRPPASWASLLYHPPSTLGRGNCPCLARRPGFAGPDESRPPTAGVALSREGGPAGETWVSSAISPLI